MQQFKFRLLAIAVLAVASIGFIACGPAAGPGTTQTGDGKTADVPAGNAATVNGKAISMAEVEKFAKQQAGDQWGKLSPLEIAQLRVQTLNGLIRQEVLFQKAEAEKTIPSEDDVNAEFTKAKTASGKTAEEIEKQMKESGENEQSVKDGIKKQLAINKLLEKISNRVDAPKESEITDFYKGNPEAFVKKKGVKLSVIVVDPQKSSEADKTVDEASANLKAQEINTKLKQGVDFATVARESSEDPSAQNGGDTGYIPEDQLKQAYGGQLVGFMDPKVPIGTQIARPLDGKIYFIKLVERSDKDENLTLESPGIREQVTDSLTNLRKRMVQDSFIAQSMFEAKIDNLLLKQIIENPNNLSGARPAVSPDANTNTNANSNAGANANKTANANAKPAANANAKPAANANANAKPAANTTANTVANTAANTNTANK